MIRLEKSEALQRKIRQDDMAELGKPTDTLVREAIQAGRTNEALDFFEYSLAEHLDMHDSLVDFNDDTLTYFANTSGEEEVMKAIKSRYDKRFRYWLKSAPSLLEQIYLHSEGGRGDFADFAAVEEPDRYVMTYNTCDLLRVWRNKKDLGTTKQAYPWSWSRSGVPYYCAHCCLCEQIATEVLGYPVYINLCPEKPENPCLHLYYKKPELIPEEYFTRIGMTKTIK